MTVLVDTHTVRTQATNVIERHGVAAPVAYIVVQSLLEASLRGYDSLGIARLPGYCEALRSGAINPQGMPDVVNETSTTMRVDGHGGFGHVAAAFAMGKVIRKTQEYGMAAASIFNCSSADLMGNYAEMATERGFIGMACRSGAWAFDSGGMTDAGAREGSRWAVALPTDVLMAVVLDDAPFPHPGAIPSEGVMLPLLAHVVGGLLARAGYQPGQEDPGAMGTSMFVCALSVEQFGSLDSFTRRIPDMREQFKTTLPVNEAGIPLLPGEAAFAVREQRMVSGIPLDDSVWSALLSL